MRKALLYGPRDLRVVDVEEPQPGPTEVRIRVTMSAIYGTDLKFYRGAHRLSYPAGFGADFVGVVDAVGREVTGFSIGDRVVANDMPHCGRCTMCQSGRTNLCLSIADPMKHRAECFQELTLAPASRACRIPENVRDEDGATMAAINTALNIFERAALREPARVLVIGAGAMGTGVVQTGAALGHEIAVLQRHPERIGLLRELGARHQIDDAAPEAALRALWPDGYEAVIDAAGHEETAALAVDLAWPGSTVVLLGTGQWGLASRPIAHKELHVLGVRGGHHQGEAVNLVSQGRLGLGKTIGKTFPLSKAAEALALAESDSRYIRIALDHHN